MLLVVLSAVGAVGIPVKAGLLIFAFKFKLFCNVTISSTKKLSVYSKSLKLCIPSPILNLISPAVVFTTANSFSNSKGLLVSKLL